MCRKLFFLTSFVVVLALVGSASADIAISTQAGWFGQGAADREMQEIVDNVTAVTVEQFTADQQDALADWVVAHTGDGVSDILILCGNFPDTIYPPGNAQPDGSLAELFLDDGNTIVNTGDYMFYVNSGGTNNNAAGGLQNMMDIANGAIDMWDDNTPANVTAEGQGVAPSLGDFQTDRPFHLDALEGDWVPELILAQNDAGTRADPVIVVNTVTGGRLGIFYQTSGQDDDPRGEVISEWINNFVLTGGEIPNSPALKPNPADGAVDADVSSLEWVAGYGAVSHKVYLSTDATVDESDFLADTELALQFADLASGTTYYWRVDEVDAEGAVIEGNIWSFSTLPIEAHFPDPEDGATEVPVDAQLSWTAGKNAILHDVYFGTDEAAVAAGDPSTFQGKLMENSFDPGPLEPFMTYYWKVDEFAMIVTNPGPVWSFSTPTYLVISDEETTLDYDNGAEPYLSEVAFDTPQDLTISGLADLTLRFHGAPAHEDEGSASLDEATGTYSITGSGADVWDSSDQFHFAYRELTGDGEIVARVVDNGTGTNAWAKGGVMIRETLSAGSKHNIAALTGSEGGGITFQGRPVTGERSNSMHGDITASPPHWVKLTRVGNTFTAYHSADGVTWEIFTDTATDGDITNPIDVEMADPVLIGLFVTAHQSDELRTYTFDNVDIVGDISADSASTDVGLGGNSPEPIYVALEDSTGAVATVTHPYAEATMIDAWRDWTIPLSKFTGVDPADAVMLYVGVGDGEPGGSGTIRVDDIRVVMSATAANIILVSGNHDYDMDGVVDDFLWVEILEAEGHTVDYQPGNWTELDDDKIAALNAADLVIISRCSNSSDYADGDEVAQWNAVTTPMLNCSTHLIRSSRWLWLDTTTLPNISDAVVDILAPDHPIFASIESPAWVTDGLVGETTFADITGVGAGNGTLLAKVADTDVAWIVEWEAGVEFYPGSGEIAGGPRMFFAVGTQEVADVSNWGEWNLTPEGKRIFLNAVNMLLPAKVADVTVPGDIVKGFPDDGDWPGAETPPLAIDDNTGTKYLHFKGETEPTGIQVTPLEGPSIVTGLTFTTANDAAERDPIAFELYGSNESIDGPYELIASGDIVDFAQEAAWPRFTKNETPISFDNSAAYGHYQVLFPAVRDAASANSMQIAEVELIGVPEPIPADVTALGDAIQGVPNDGDWPGAETPDLAIDNNKRTKYLHFKGDFDPDPGTGGTGFQVTPSAGSSIVTGLTLTTANDTPGRDPIAFELSGSNESIDGPYELIASGDIVDFAQEAEWPRFRMNATPISFDNTAAYAHYQLIFTAIRGPVGGSVNSMQIAEVELIGLPVVPFSYTYDGDALDDAWDHDNGSDQWDGTAPGEGNPGGAAALTEDGVTFLRIQDIGDPRDLGISEPSNRKVYLQRPMDISLDGARLEFCVRVATSAPLDNQVTGEPWPAEGIGYHIRDNGKGMVGIGEAGEAGVGIISFSLAQPGEAGFEDVATDVLVMNNLVGTEASGDVDTEDAAAAVAMNMIAIDDATQWNTFTIDIAAGGAGTHIVTVSANGGPAESFEVTMGTDLEGDISSLLIGSSGTGGITAFDVDYITVSN